MPPKGEPIYFETPDELRDWLAKHHDSRSELFVGHWKKASGHRTVTWEQIVEEALCYGWIDGVRHSIDEHRTSIRITPRRPGSNWSQVNIAKVAELRKAGRMRPAGEKAFEARREDRSGVYSYEQRHLAKLEPEQTARFRMNEKAWSWFEAASPSYRQMVIWWVVSAKRPETRDKRLTTLIEDSEAGRKVGPLAERPGS